MSSSSSPPSSDHIVCLVTTPSDEVSKKLAHVLLEKRLAACVNIIPGITSCYLWEGKIQQDTEQLLVGAETARHGYTGWVTQQAGHEVDVEPAR